MWRVGVTPSAMQTQLVFLISSFRRVLYVVWFLLGHSPASGVYIPTFRNTLFHLNRHVDVDSTHIYLPMKLGQCVPKRRHINSRRRGIIQKKATTTCVLSTLLLTWTVFGEKAVEHKQVFCRILGKFLGVVCHCFPPIYIYIGEGGGNLWKPWATETLLRYCP
jgi:hypothetical protein